MLYEGGNVKVIDVNNNEIYADKVDLTKVSRSEFISITQKLFKKINQDFKKLFGKRLWSPKDITSLKIFNGSSSFVLDTSITDDELIKHKKNVGDIDIMVDSECGDELFNYLSDLKGSEVIKGVEYIGSNRDTSEHLGDQINSIFRYKFSNGELVNVQVDFELTEFENGSPTEWAAFSHSSDFSDTKKGVKAVHHKYLLRALMYASSLVGDIVVATPASTPDKIRPKKNPPKNSLKFSVTHGVRDSLIPMLDDNGEQVHYDGKPVYQEKPTKDSFYIKNIDEIMNIAFGGSVKIDNPRSFVSLLKSLKKKPQSFIENVLERYVELLWGQGAQGIERNNPAGDLAVKNPGYQLFCKTTGVYYPDLDKLLKQYYDNYRMT